jgi:hypothetical protein
MRTKLTFIYGVAINDADYNVTKSYIDDSGTKIVTTCPIYTVWKNMLTRVYSKGYHQKNPQYAEVSVHQDWLSFMVFRAWALERHFEGSVLDKDLYDPTAKCYSEDTCTFVSQDINQLIHYKERKKVSSLPTGVSLTSSTNKRPYYARLQRYGKYVRLGTFDTVIEAESAYLTAKAKYMMEVAQKQTCTRIRQGLKRHIRVVGVRFYNINAGEKLI